MRIAMRIGCIALVTALLSVFMASPAFAVTVNHTGPVGQEIADQNGWLVQVDGQWYKIAKTDAQIYEMVARGKDRGADVTMSGTGASGSGAGTQANPHTAKSAGIP